MAAIYFFKQTDGKLAVSWRDRDAMQERTLSLKIAGDDFAFELSPEEASRLRDSIGETLDDVAGYMSVRPAFGAGETTPEAFRMARFIKAAPIPDKVSNGDLVAAGFAGWQVRTYGDAARLIAAGAPRPGRIDGSTRIAAFSGHEGRAADQRRPPDWSSTLDDFRAANPDMTADEVGLMVTALETNGEYRIGGGAEAEFTIRLAPAADAGAKAA